MSLYESKMPSLRDKLAAKAITEDKTEVVEVKKVEVKKGRRLNK